MNKSISGFSDSVFRYSFIICNFLSFSIVNNLLSPLNIIICYFSLSTFPLNLSKYITFVNFLISLILSFVKSLITVNRLIPNSSPVYLNDFVFSNTISFLYEHFWIYYVLFPQNLILTFLFSDSTDGYIFTLLHI
jgi:hypothetical protein